MVETIYVKLLDENINVWKPVKAESTESNTVFRILPEPTNKKRPGESWEFTPGAFVIVKEMSLEGKISKVAIALMGS